MRPHVGLERRDVEIADEDRLAVGLDPVSQPRISSRKSSLCANLSLTRRVRHVAAGRDVEVVEDDVAAAVGMRRADVAASPLSQKPRLSVAANGTRETMATP